MFSGKLRNTPRVVIGALLGLSLAACAVYEPAPTYSAYPSYGYAPGYYYAPAPTTSFSFGYFSGPSRHHHHHHRHWRG